jgi:hypothetical protein
MRIAAIVIAALAFMIGLRLVVTALQAALTGKILVRDGFRRSKWQPAPSRDDAWRAAFRDGLMGILLIVLGVMLFT